jgi:hypothetical protein
MEFEGNGEESKGSDESVKLAKVVPAKKRGRPSKDKGTQSSTATISDILVKEGQVEIAENNELQNDTSLDAAVTEDVSRVADIRTRGIKSLHKKQKTEVMAASSNRRSSRVMHDEIVKENQELTPEVIMKDSIVEESDQSALETVKAGIIDKLDQESTSEIAKEDIIVKENKQSALEDSIIKDGSLLTQEDINHSSTPELVAIKKGRGRPKSIVIGLPGAKTIIAVKIAPAAKIAKKLAVKKGRGRPRKDQSIDNTIIDESIDTGEPSSSSIAASKKLQQIVKNVKKKHIQIKDRRNEKEEADERKVKVSEIIDINTKESSSLRVTKSIKPREVTKNIKKEHNEHKDDDNDVEEAHERKAKVSAKMNMSASESSSTSLAMSRKPRQVNVKKNYIEDEEEDNESREAESEEEEEAEKEEENDAEEDEEVVAEGKLERLKRLLFDLKESTKDPGRMLFKKAMQAIEKIDQMTLSVDELTNSGAAKQIGELRKISNMIIAARAKRLRAKWIEGATKNMLAATTIAVSSSDSSASIASKDPIQEVVLTVVEHMQDDISASRTITSFEPVQEVESESGTEGVSLVVEQRRDDTSTSMTIASLESVQEDESKTGVKTVLSTVEQQDQTLGIAPASLVLIGSDDSTNLALEPSEAVSVLQQPTSDSGELNSNYCLRYVIFSSNIASNLLSKIFLYFI